MNCDDAKRAKEPGCGLLIVLGVIAFWFYVWVERPFARPCICGHEKARHASNMCIGEYGGCFDCDGSWDPAARRYRFCLKYEEGR